MEITERQGPPSVARWGCRPALDRLGGTRDDESLFEDFQLDFLAGHSVNTYHLLKLELYLGKFHFLRLKSI